MPAFKRSAPALRQQARDQDRLEGFQEYGMKPTPTLKPRSLLDKLREIYVGALNRKQAIQNPPPVEEGSKVQGFGGESTLS